MYNNTYRIRERSYSEMLAGLADACETLNLDKLSVAVSASGIEKRFSTQSTSSALAAKHLRQEAEVFSSHPWVRCFHFDVQLEALHSRNHTPSLVYQADGDKAPVLRMNNFKTVENPIPVLAALHKALDFIPFDSGQASLLGESEARILLRQQDAGNSLLAEIDRLGRFTTEQIERNSRHFEALTVKADEYLVGMRERLESEYREKHAELDKGVKALAAEKAELDSRENRHARRALLADIRKQIQDNSQVHLSASTNEKRHAIRMASFGAMAIGLLLLITMLVLAASSGAADWYEIAGASTGTLLFGSTLVFYLRWENLWSTQHADFEWRNRKFADDALRASWLAELLFEWHEEKGKGPFPPELIRSFSTDLFATWKTSASEHPSEDLVKLLQSLKRVRVGRNLLEVERAERPAGGEVPRGQVHR